MQRLLLLIVFMLVTTGCDNCIEKEIFRTSSLNGTFDAVLVGENCGGAVGEYVSSVYIVQKGKTKNYKSSERVFEALDLQDVNMRWLRNDILEIQYKKARILHFRNYIIKTDNSKSHVLEVRETPLISPPSFEHRAP